MASYLTLAHAFLLISLLSLWAARHTVAEVYTVGGAEGWDIGQNYLLWSQQYNFTVGDVLQFQYVEGQHNVNEVTEATFRSCDSTSGIIRSFTSGNDLVNLTESAKFWFICSTKGHCKGGMRFGINVTSATSDNGGSTPPVGEEAPPPPPLTVAPGNAAAKGGMGWGRSWLVGCCLVVCGLLHLLSH